MALPAKSEKPCSNGRTTCSFAVFLACSVACSFARAMKPATPFFSVSGVSFPISVVPHARTRFVYGFGQLVAFHRRHLARLLLVGLAHDLVGGVLVGEPRDRERRCINESLFDQRTRRTDGRTVVTRNARRFHHGVRTVLKADSSVLAGAFHPEYALDLHVVTRLDAPITENAFVAIDLDKRRGVV